MNHPFLAVILVLLEVLEDGFVAEELAPPQLAWEETEVRILVGKTS